MRRDPKDKSEARQAIRQCRGTFLMTGFFSFFINLLMLTIPLYMLLVYDRVLTSGNHSTLIALSILVGILLAIMGTLEFLRSRILVRVGGRIDRALSSRVFDAFMKRARTSGTDKGERPLQDLNTFKDFLSGQGPLALFDAPWAPIYLAVLFLLHPLLGLVATGGALVLFTIALLNELTTRGPLGNAAKLQDKAGVYAADGQRNAEVLGSMGMLGGLRERWQWYHRYARHNQAKASDRAGGFTACSKTTRLALQAAILGTGATLAIEQIITPGAMIAASIIMGRALQPVEQTIGNWRHFNAARSAFRRLDALLRQVPAPAAPTRLPDCRGYLTVEKLYAGPPEAQKPLLTNIRFNMFPGQALGIIGPSSSGKSTLVRMLTGIWQPQHGAVRLDNATLAQWEEDQLGRNIGYLPQDVELFSGTVKENISRFAGEADDDEVVAAAQRAGVHDMILELPDGYETQIGGGGSKLSGGQRQRIALARALYGDPVLVVLDEPNSNLDADGEAALTQAIMDMKARERTVVVVAHRPSAISAMDKVLVLENGVQKAFGDKDDVIGSAGVRSTPSNSNVAPLNPVRAS